MEPIGQGHHLVVRNTFIDAVPEEEDDQDDPLARTRSDPTGGRSKRVLPLGRIPEQPQPITVEEGTRAEEDTEGSGEGLDVPEDDEDDEDDDGGALMRTVSTATAYSVYDMEPMSIPTHSSGRAPVPGAVGMTRPPVEGCLGVQGLPYPGVPGVGGLSPWVYAPQYTMFNGFGNVYPPFAFDRAAGMAVGAAACAVAPPPLRAEEGHEESVPSDWRRPAQTPALPAGPPIGMLHSFHQETRDMGAVTPDFRQFTKVGYEGRLSVVSESQVHTDGVHRYLVQFTSGELSRADGVGFVFSPRLPCAKNIQRIVSIFVNQRGRICMRVFADIVRASAYVKPLELGDWVEMAIDLDAKVATFNIWPCTPSGWPPTSGRPTSTAEFPFGNKLSGLNQANQKPVKLNVGHLACVVKNVGVTVTLSS